MCLEAIILSDNQAITAAGILHFLNEMQSPCTSLSEAKNKRILIQELSKKENALVILDYTFFDFSSVDELLIVRQRFPQTHFLLFLEELTEDFIRKVVFSEDSFSILLKDCDKEEINTALHTVLKNERFICNRVSNQLSTTKRLEEKTQEKLTSTEKEVLKSMALGKSTKEIAAERFSSIHTIVTHRKNIFRKLEVNNVHEATKYALRAGIVNAAEYYI